MLDQSFAALTRPESRVISKVDGANDSTSSSPDPAGSLADVQDR